ncbi:ribonuclease HII [candidate division KSB1 bacterium]|nr:ribonuclease HII [candidate division KSB1 bacterium]
MLYDRHKRDEFGAHLIGVDEAGRGPLAGPVVAAAVIFPPDIENLEEITDSKLLTAQTRQRLEIVIKEKALAYATAAISNDEIDRINILQASLLAMQRAVEQIRVPPHYILVDGNRLPIWEYRSEALIKGDQQSMSIAAASILAKEARDRLMIEYDTLYPEYSFASHKGYATRGHLDAIAQYGLCKLHRRSFQARELLEKGIYE